MKNNSNRCLIIGCIVILILVLTVAGVAFAIQLTKDQKLLKGQEGKDGVTETFTWSTTDKPKEEDGEEEGVNIQEGKFTPKIVGTLDFGDDDESYDVEFPSYQYPLLLDNKTGKDVRLTSITYKTEQTYLDIDGDGDEEDYLKYISGIQLGLSNDFDTSMFQHSSQSSWGFGSETV